MCYSWHTVDTAELMIEFRFVLKRTVEFGRWYSALCPGDQARVDGRLEDMIQGRFGNSRSLGEGLFELKWKNGMRVYFSRKRVARIDIFVLWGGFKGTQDADIAKARRLKTRSEHEAEIEGPKE
jgi:putative addiction module killer protein